MIGSLFKEMPPIPNDEREVPEFSEEFDFEPDSKNPVTAILPLVQKIVRRKPLLSWHSEASDLVQSVALRLLKWRNKYQEKSEEMSSQEWEAFAARTTFNEVNRHLTNNSSGIEIPLEAVAEVSFADSLEGSSEIEFCSLARGVWQKICNLTLRQKQAVLLSSQKLIIYFMQAGISDYDLAVCLELTIDEWMKLKEEIPFKDVQIAEMVKEAGNPNSLDSIAKSVKKARFEARGKLRRLTDK